MDTSAMPCAFMMLHGVMDAAAAVRVTAHAPRDALDAGPVQIIVAGRVCAMVTPIPPRLADGRASAALLESEETVAALAVAHNRILTELSAQGAVAPVKLGAAFADDAATRAAVTAREAAFRRALDHIDGAGEYAVRVVDAPAGARRVAPEVEAAACDPAAIGGRAYLHARGARRRARDAAAQRIEAFLDALSDQIAALARAVVAAPPSPSAPGRPARRLDLAVLADADGAARLEALVTSMTGPAHDLGLAIEASGPWPAYSFVEADDAPPRRAA